MDPRPERMFRPEAVLRAGAAIFALIAAGLVALLVTAHLEAVDPRTLPAVRPPKASAPTPAPSPLTDLGRGDLGSVVTIQVEVELSNEESLGTGWIFDSKGDIVTNAHVISGHVAIRVTDRSDRTEVAVVLGSDATNDIALLRPEGAFPGQELPVDAAAFVKVPASVIALASSTATGRGDMTAETLIGLHANVPLAPNGGVDQGQVGPQIYNDMLHLEGERIYEGNSGGPVLDAAGQVVGILTLASPSSPDAYAIPISRVLAELIQWSKSG
ncbi:MAG TPA: serine protease [Candidatus Acidoferrales bacterium]|nr:serine protease [Candidatus Acidoferrales bacterium]